MSKVTRCSPCRLCVILTPAYYVVNDKILTQEPLSLPMTLGVKKIIIMAKGQLKQVVTREYIWRDAKL